MSKRKIVGLMGAKGAGKDTAAAFLLKHRNFFRVGFADALYREVAEAFGVTVAFLGDRTLVQTPSGLLEHKEAPCQALSLSACADPGFVQCVLEELASSGIEPGTPLSPRVVMQQWGTEYRRKRGVDSYWLDIVSNVLTANPSQDVVITDVRFPNEHAFVKALNGYNMRVRNLEVEAREAANRAANGASAHSSETAVQSLPAHREIFNVPGQLEALCSDVLDAVDSLDPAFA